MKSNFFKYIFIIFAITIMIYAIIKIKSDDKKQENEVYQIEEEEKIEIKELRLGVASFDSINPILSKNKNIQDISKIIFESLVTITEDYRLENCLIKEWAKQNETSYIIKLKNKIKWSDGEEFTSEDVKFTIDRLKDSDTIYYKNIEHIIEVEVVDDTTFRIILDQEIPFFEYNLTFPILSSKYYSDKEFIPDIVPIGTGMYKVSEVQESSLILTKNEYYSGNEDLKIEKIIVTMYSSIGELYNSFKTGGVDIISTQNSNLKDYIGTIGYESKEMKGREHDFIAFNTQNVILSQIPVRKAISYSIDKANIVSSIYADNYIISSFPLDYGTYIYQEQDTSLGYNVEHAKQILVDDGWEYKYRYWQKIVEYRTQRLSFNFVVKSSDSKKVEVAQNIKLQLENQGIRINLIKATDEQYQNYLNTKNYDMILCSINLSISPDLTTFFGEGNLSNYYNEETINLMNEIKNLSDENKLIENYKRLGEIYKNEMPYLSLYNNKYIVAYTTNLSGIVNPNWFYQFYNIKDWHK